jgi:hypothetical protein
MLIFAKEWTTSSGRSTYGQSFNYFKVLHQPKNCVVRLQCRTCLSNPKSKEASDRHSPVGEDLADLVDVHDTREGREPCSTQP